MDLEVINTVQLSVKDIVIKVYAGMTQRKEVRSTRTFRNDSIELWH